MRSSRRVAQRDYVVWQLMSSVERSAERSADESLAAPEIVGRMSLGTFFAAPELYHILLCCVQRCVVSCHSAVKITEVCTQHDIQIRKKSLARHDLTRQRPCAKTMVWLCVHKSFTELHVLILCFNMYCHFANTRLTDMQINIYSL